MYAKQISVLIESTKERLVELTSLLGENGIDLLALSLADNTDFVMVRAIVSDPEKTVKVLQSSGYTAKLTDVLAVAVPDEAGGLASILRLLKEHDIPILYLYSLVRRVCSKAVIIFRVDEQEKALDMILQNGITLLGQGQLSASQEP